MPMSPIISVVVPVYQTEKYLRECLYSLSRQTYKNLEFLLIDDGSTDRSPQICDEQASADSRFRVFHREHAGIATSRNYGLKMATGEFIAWVDSDDSIEPEYIQNLYDALSQNNADGSFAIQKKDEEYLKVLVDGEILQSQLEGKLGVLWSSLIRTSLYQGKTFVDYAANEDNIMLAQICATTHRAVVIQSNGYHYRIRRDSAVHSLNAKSMQERLEALATRNAWVRQNYPTMYKYTHYTSVLEATKVNRMLRDNAVEGNTETLRCTIKKMIREHIFKIPISSLNELRIKEILAGYKALGV